MLKNFTTNGASPNPTNNNVHNAPSGIAEIQTKKPAHPAQKTRNNK
jgi:hypothetical protein